ncbi:MAG: hypothetical protein QOE05_1024, partial [Actinomycetota bacterium]|nr:hypothetical protein [Actinomycetota bacterium]
VFLDVVNGLYRRLVLEARGEPVPPPLENYEEVTAIQMRSAAIALEAVRHLAAGEEHAAFESAKLAIETFVEFGGFDDDFPTYWCQLLDVALSVDELEVAGRWLHKVADAPRGQLSTVLRALVPYFRARLGAVTNADDALVDADFVSGATALGAFGAPYWQGRCLLEHAEWLSERGRATDATVLVDEADRIFTSLRATPWIDRARKARTLTLR